MKFHMKRVDLYAKLFIFMSFKTFSGKTAIGKQLETSVMGQLLNRTLIMYMQR